MSPEENAFLSTLNMSRPTTERPHTRVLDQDEIDELLGFDERRGWSVRPLFAWYDLWVGAFWDRKSRKLYILPLPCIGVVIQFPVKP